MTTHISVLNEEYNSLITEYQTTYNTLINAIGQQSNRPIISNKVLQYSNELQAINDRLLQINSSLMEEIHDQSTTDIILEKSKMLQQNYNTLINERQQINDITETLNQSQEIMVSSNYYTYIIYLLIAVCLVFVLIKTSFSNEKMMGGGTSFNKTPFIVVFMLCVIFINAWIKIKQ